ncbi:ATPase family associated with various cellular activities (AAA) [Thioclava dalianensis]|nr:AAA family ATPase [Thioclava dalianensis]SFM72033.1 ATPase family associated with various cellular activities (AAA) [Thioclava dalianensis]
MASLSNDRMAVLSPTLDVPRVEDMEARFLAFWRAMRRTMHGRGRKAQLDYAMERKAKDLAEVALQRRLSQSGLATVKTEARPGVIVLAREGGKLSGPTTPDDVHHLVAALHAESGWMREVSTWIMHQMLQHVASGGRGLTLPPVILVGPPGIGKSHYARKLAELAGLPVRMIDVGAGSAGFRISGTEKGWATAQSGLPVETMLATRVANPLMIVDEVDKAGTAHSTRGTSTSLTTSLLQMLEPGTARHFECPYLRIPVDMSRVIWIMTANNLAGIPAPLRDRARLFILPNLSATDAIAHFDRLTVGCGWETERDRCRIFIERMSRRPEGISLRQIGKLVDALHGPIAPLYQ